MNFQSRDSKIVIVGSGISALYSAINLSDNLDIVIITNKTASDCNSYLAQGGISTCKDKNDIDSFILDTLKAGSFKNSYNFVETLAKDSFSNINNLLNLNVNFNRDIYNNLLYTREGAHSTNRILYHKDSTGKAIWTTLFNIAHSKSNITILENCSLVDLIIHNNNCYGIVYKNKNSFIQHFATKTILATGGIGGLFKNSTNFNHINGVSIFLALQYKIKLKDLDYIQFHPTAFYSSDYNRNFLVSESLRGEGGVLLNINKERFTNELLPRDKLTSEILLELKKTNSDYVYLDIRHLGTDYIIDRFPTIYKTLLGRNIDITTDLIPVRPSHHYHMGGIQVDINSKSSCNNLYVVGEASCTGVHGKNRLASNSLLESIVFSQRASISINNSISLLEPTYINYTPNSYIFNFEQISSTKLKDLFSQKGDFIKNELDYSRQNNKKCSGGGYS